MALYKFRIIIIIIIIIIISQQMQQLCAAVKWSVENVVHAAKYV